MKEEVNKRNTLKLLLFDNGLLAFVQPKIYGRSETILNIPWTLSHKPSLWNDLKEGVYVLLEEGYWDNWYLVGVTDMKTEKEAKEFLEIYEEILRIQNLNNYEELAEVKKLNYDGRITLEEFRKHLKKNQEVLKECERLEKEEERKRIKALNENIEFVEEIYEDKEILKITIKALDGHTYKLELKNLRRGIAPKYFEEMVYRHRYALMSYPLEKIKEETLMKDFYSFIEMLIDDTDEPIVIQVDRRKPLTLSHKKVKTRNVEYTLYYINGVKIPRGSLLQILMDYFIFKKDLPKPKPKSRKKKDFLTSKERELIMNGISGTLSDLEGEIPINIGVEKEGQKWFLVIGEKKIYIKGGLATIESIKNVLEGKANRYNARHSTEELFYRLTRVIDEKTALEIISTAKEIGLMVKALTK